MKRNDLPTSLFRVLRKPGGVRKPMCALHMLIPIMIALFLSLAGCGSSRKGNGFAWESSGNALIDSLTNVLDSGFMARISIDTLSRQIESFDKALTATEDPGVKLRKDLFQGWYLGRQGKQKEATEVWTKAREALDSAQYPYLYNMLNMMLDDFPALSPEKYHRTIDRLNFFRSRHDDFMSAAMLTEAGNFLKDCRDLDAAIQAYDEADSLYTITGYRNLTVFNRINRANVMAHAGDSAGCVQLLESLLHDPAVIAAPSIKPIVLENLYINSEKEQYLDSLDVILGDNPTSLMLRYRGLNAMRAGKFDEAIDLCQQAYTKAEEEGNADELAWALYSLSNALGEAGHKDEAYDVLYNASELTDQIAEMKSTDEIRGLETGRLLAEERLRAELAESRSILKWVWVAFGVLLLVVIAAVSSVMIIRNMKIRQLRMRLEQEKMERKLIASSILLEGKDRMIQEIGEHISTLSDAASSGSSQANIDKSLHLQKIAEKGREGVMEAYTQANPEFIARLKKAAPEITETDIRFACYISVGMDNKAIAALTGIRHESVKQARWRLRKKLGLSTSDSLEDYLRSLT